ncbi:hypothetical protein RSAG8_12877, partial [Rhizoctonia solani AG-8 WAC10335]
MRDDACIRCYRLLRMPRPRLLHPRGSYPTLRAALGG